jgi:hypothetical protein
MTKQQFIAAAKRVEQEDSEKEGAEPEVLEFSLAGQDFVADLPTNTQIVLLSATLSGGRTSDVLTGSLECLEGVLRGNGYKRIRRLVAQCVVSTDLLIGGDENNDKGIVDSIVAMVSDGRPPTRSTGSSGSQKPGGKKSTGRAPGKGSIPSAFPSADSST